ncbi:MAG: sugar porter family MFS transporter [Sphingobacteriales bacterium]
MNQKVIFWSVITALGGFLFGFDTVVVSGAEQALQKYWHLGDFQQGFTIAIALVGTMVGAFGGRMPADKLGRKVALMIVALIFLVTSLGTAFATNWYLFVILRFIGGLGIGASSVIAPVYITEISPASYRGRLVILFQGNIVLGIVLALLSNYIIVLSYHGSWRLMMAVMAAPSLLYLILLRFVPESPRWLILHKARYDDAKETLKVMNPNDYEQEMQSIVNSKNEEVKDSSSEKLFSKRYRRLGWLAFLIAFFNQVSGINAILYYAPSIFTLAGFSKNDSFSASFYLGLVNFVFTMLAIFLIDRAGRRKLMLIGSYGLILSLGLVSYCFHLKNADGHYVIWLLMAYIAFFAISQGAVIWVFLSEIFPNQVRAKGQSLGSFTHWFMATVITFLFPAVRTNIPGEYIFMFFCAMMVLQLLFVWKMMPETKGKSLENMERSLTIH